MGPDTRDKLAFCSAPKTDSLRQAIAKFEFQALLLGIHRDEHSIRAKARYFYLGIVANDGHWSDCDSSLMRPVYLDHIARSIPELKIIGARPGNRSCDEAATACRWNPNRSLRTSEMPE